MHQTDSEMVATEILLVLVLDSCPLFFFFLHLQPHLRSMLKRLSLNFLPLIQYKIKLTAWFAYLTLIAIDQRRATQACHFSVIFHPNGSLLSTRYMICSGATHMRCAKLTASSMAVTEFLLSPSLSFLVPVSSDF